MLFLGIVLLFIALIILGLNINSIGNILELTFLIPLVMVIIGGMMILTDMQSPTIETERLIITNRANELHGVSVEDGFWLIKEIKTRPKHKIMVSKKITQYKVIRPVNINLNCFNETGCKEVMEEIACPKEKNMLQVVLEN